jgi:hypothetical protein
LSATSIAIALVGVVLVGSAIANNVGPVAGTGIYRLGDDFSQVSSPAGYSLVIGGQGDAGTLASLPGRSLVYFAGTDVNTKWSTGVPYSQALASGWLLKDSSGNLLLNKGHPDNYVGDVGSAGYQQAWITNVLAFLAAQPGLEGVCIDDVLYDLIPMTGVEAAEYPTKQAWASAQLSFVAAVGTALRANGYYVLLNASGYVPGDPNSDDGTNTVTWWQQLGPYVNGLTNESYQETSDGSNILRSTGGAWTQNWDGWQRLVQTAQAMGKDFVGVTYGASGDTRTMTYGKASFLQDWNGGGGAFIFLPTDSSDPTNSAWTTDIGQPAAAKQQVGVGWMRQYTAGIALVNPSPTTSQTFSLGGSYLNADGATVTSVTLEPTTGLILTSSGGPASAPAASTPTIPASEPPPSQTSTPAPVPETTLPPQPAPSPAASSESAAASSGDWDSSTALIDSTPAAPAPETAPVPEAGPPPQPAPSPAASSESAAASSGDGWDGSTALTDSTPATPAPAPVAETTLWAQPTLQLAAPSISHARKSWRWSGPYALRRGVAWILTPSGYSLVIADWTARKHRGGRPGRRSPVSTVLRM